VSLSGGGASRLPFLKAAPSTVGRKDFALKRSWVVDPSSSDADDALDRRSPVNRRSDDADGALESLIQHWFVASILPRTRRIMMPKTLEELARSSSPTPKKIVDNDDLYSYDSDEVQFVPDSVIGAAEEFVPDSVGVDEVGVAPAGSVAGGQLDDSEVCYSMLRILLPDYFKIPGNEKLGM
jgi:hypothetical protein